MSLTVKRDLEMLKDGIFEGLKPILNDLFEGAEDDIKAFGAAIASDMVRAIDGDRQDLVDELKGQLELLVEDHRLRVVAAKEVVLETTLPNTLDLIFSIATKALQAVKVV